MFKKILILNWRDPKSPLEGGAERFTYKYAQYWVKNGNKVFWLTNSFRKSKKKEKENGVCFIRIGPKLNGRLLNYILLYPIFLIKTIIFARKFIKENNIDIVIDEIHGFPFFSPLFTKKRNILLVCEVAGPIWKKMFPWPINIIGERLEKIIYRIYKNSEIWAISKNTKKNILKINPKLEVKILPLGIDRDKKIFKEINGIKKTKYPSAIFLARLVKMKGIETALNITKDICKKLPDFKLFIVGDGNTSYVKYLKEKSIKLGIKKNVEFLGFLNEGGKFKYLKKSHFLLHPSYKEGFGLTVVEAGLVGTPAIIRSGSSLDELIEEGYNGFKFKKDEEIKNIFVKNYKNNIYKKLSKNAKLNAQKYLWTKILKSSIKVTNIN